MNSSPDVLRRTFMCFSLEEVPWLRLMNASWNSLSGSSQKIASLENALLSEEHIYMYASFSAIKSVK